MDPVSAAASILTLLAAAGSSCKFIYELVHDIAEAPAEIQAHNSRLESLARTFSTMLQIYSTLPPDTPVDMMLTSRMHEFLEEIKIVQHRIGATSRWASLGRSQRMRMRCKWLASDRRLFKFFASLEQWNIVFSQTMLAVQTKLLLDIREQSASLIHVQSQPPLEHRICPESWPRIPLNASIMEPLELPLVIESGSKGSPHSSKRLSSYLAAISEPVGYRIGRRYEIISSSLDFSLRCGSTIVRHWSEDGRETYAILPICEGYSISFTFQANRFWHHRINLVIHGLYQWSSLLKFKLHTTLRVSALLPYEGQYWKAVKLGDVELLKHVLCGGQHSISDTTRHGDTSLHIATRYQNNEAVLFLLENGADIDATNDRGETPLHLALKCCKDYEIPRLFLAKGADTYRTDIDGRTPFHTFFSDTIRTLIRWHKADIDITTQDYQGMTIMHYISRSSRSHLEDIAWCFKNTLPPKDALGRSVLHLAAQRGNISLLRYLLNLPGASALATPDYMGCTLLHYATESRRVDTIDLLLNAGYGDINLKDHKGRTLMHHAASRGNVDAVQRLIELGAENLLHVLDEDGCAPIQVAKAYGVDERLGIESLVEEVKDDVIDKDEQLRLHGLFTAIRMVIALLSISTLWWISEAGLLAIVLQASIPYTRINGREGTG